jgi:hypothetical protein
MLMQIKANRTGFLSFLGGLNPNVYNQYGAFKFPMSQEYELPAGSQPAISEASSVTGQTPDTQTRSQLTNTVQIFQEAYQVSYKKESGVQEFSGVQLSGMQQEPTSEMDFQRASAMGRMALDMDYSFLNGSYQEASDTATPAKTRGLITAITTNTVDAGSADLTKDMITELLVAMKTYSDLDDPVFIGGAFQKTQISALYGYAPEDRNVGGVNITQVVTDFGTLGYVEALQCPASTLLIADASKLKVVYCPVRGQLIIDEPLSKSGASDRGQIYAQAGIDYANEKLHGKITDLTTS